MYDLATINGDQLVTATDRLLAGVSKRHPRSTRGLSCARVAVVHDPVARGTSRGDRARANDDAPTMYMRARVSSTQLGLLAAAAAIAWFAVALRLLA